MQTNPNATDVTSVFGRTLAALRSAAGLSQVELGDLLKMDRTAIARLEIGRTTLSVPVVAAAEQVLLRLQAIRRPGDLTALGERTTERLLAQGVTVCVDRPPAHMPILPTRTLVRAAEAVIDAWIAELRAEGNRVGELATPAPAPRLLLAGDRLRTTPARPIEIAQRAARTVRPTQWRETGGL